jgi:hypothetical protein
MSVKTVKEMVASAIRHIDSAVTELAEAEERTRVIQETSFAGDSIRDGERDAVAQDARDEMESVLIELVSIAKGMAEAQDLADIGKLETWAAEASAAKESRL